MEAFYGLVFGVCAIMAAVLEWGNRSGADGKNSALPTDFVAFKNNYLLVYTLMMGKDMIHAPRIPLFIHHLDYSTYQTILCSWRLAPRSICLCSLPALWL